MIGVGCVVEGCSCGRVVEVVVMMVVSGVVKPIPIVIPTFDGNE